MTALPIALVLLIAVGGTVAYLSTRTNVKDNQFAFHPAGLEIVEDFDGWDAKQVLVKNTSKTVPGAARVMLLPRVEDADGNMVSVDVGAMAAPASGSTTFTMGDFTFHLAEDWADNWFWQDGFFYCRTVLEPEGLSPLLLEKVEFTGDDAAKSKYAGMKIKVDVLAGILQAEGGAAQSEWNVHVLGGVVSPATGGDRT